MRAISRFAETASDLLKGHPFLSLNFVRIESLLPAFLFRLFLFALTRGKKENPPICSGMIATGNHCIRKFAALCNTPGGRYCALRALLFSVACATEGGIATALCASQ